MSWREERRLRETAGQLCPVVLQALAPMDFCADGFQSNERLSLKGKLWDVGIAAHARERLFVVHTG